jgi:hypothetical protein
MMKRFVGPSCSPRIRGLTAPLSFVNFRLLSLRSSEIRCTDRGGAHNTDSDARWILPTDDAAELTP